ncbi:histidine phosphatase family protein [Phytoactinopolyspora mesophila]|uniref:Histidine phosphatase family protein n=1 Tax=Phytoactinopolyspora mesophila TaxID=2650750 RepID=A0A7K3M6L7_9ACTN|nr:histidine phosphatase family protein [Phytoactinopolyspora mesophila]NDL58949.1 histidine phosphatase family protein [Phytoactinopolyspora mesophila]
MAVELIYETHSTSTDNEAGVATGWLPGELSATGRQVAAELGERRRNDGLAAVFVSDLRRAVETAAIAFGDTDIPVYQDVRLRECNYGELNGMPVARLAAERKHRIEQPFPEGESYLDVVDRTRDFLADLVRAWNGSRVVIIAHSANRWAFQALLTGVDLNELVDSPFTWQPGWHFTAS